MEAHAFFLFVLVILLSARFLGELARHLGVPAVIGELLAGVILGPSLLGFIPPGEVLHLLAEVGLILLLFEVGLDTDVGHLARTGVKSMVVATGGFVLPLVFGYLLSHHVLGLPVLVSLFIGGTLTATSIGITVRVLQELGQLHSSAGQIVLGAAVADDVMGVVFLALLYQFAQGGTVSFADASKVLLFVTTFFLMAPVFAKLLGSLIKRYSKASNLPGVLPTMIISLVLFFGWLAHLFGAPEILGGFAAGVALSRRFFLPFGLSMSRDEAFSDKLAGEIRPIVYLFTPIFFVYVGLQLDLSAIDWGEVSIWVLSLSLLVIALLGKLGGAMALRAPLSERVGIGIAMAPRGEVGLIFAELGRSAGVLGNEIYSALVIVIALTTLMAPFLMKWHFKRYPSAAVSV